MEAVEKSAPGMSAEVTFPAWQGSEPKMDKVLEVSGLTKRLVISPLWTGLFFRLQGRGFGFLGSNGSGKTTTVRMLCGILTPTGGEGKYWAMISIPRLKISVRSIGYISQRFSLYEELTVVENMDFYAGTYSVSARR